MGRKHSGKRRKCWLPAFSPFLTMFSKGFYFSVVGSRDGVVRSYDSDIQRQSYTAEKSLLQKDPTEWKCNVHVCPSAKDISSACFPAPKSFLIISGIL